MATFQEMQVRLQELKNKKTILVHLTEYLDSNFRASAGDKAKNVLLTEERVAIPEEAFEQVVGDIMKSMENLTDEIEKTLATPLNATPPPLVPGHEIWSPQPTSPIPPAPQPQQAQQALPAPIQVVPTDSQSLPPPPIKKSKNSKGLN